jgi:SAM-dependent methyltransferase
VAGADHWANRAFLRDTQYKTDVNLSARQSIYAYQHPRIDLAATVLDLAAPTAYDTIVDVGCGNGLYLAELARRGFGGRVLGVDLSSGMLAAARDRLAAGPKPPGVPKPTTLTSADATALPLRDGAAGLTLAMHMLYHVPHPADVLHELRRVTRPGGRVVIGLNGAGHMRQLRAVVAAVRGDDPTSVGERVTLDDGETMARALFPRVTRHDFVAELRVPATGPVADYVRSMSGTSHHADPDRVVAAVVDTFPKSADGHYVITSHSGCLICTND